ncbi:hypothetical protein Vretimale_19001, partial [Volvox reticuliferus]
AAAATAAATLTDPMEAEHMLLLSTGDVWSSCMQTLRTNMGRVLHVAMQPAGRMVATVHDCQRGVLLWDIWGSKPLLTFASSCAMGTNPTAAFFTSRRQQACVCGTLRLHLGSGHRPTALRAL